MKAHLCYDFSTTDWEELSQRLGGDESAWPTAIGVFERRMKERFFSCIDALVKADTKPDSNGGSDDGNCIPGFSIMALCCLLIETLQGFRQKCPAPSSPAGPCSFPHGPCIKPSAGTNQQFVEFLRRPSFKQAFGRDKVAKSFVDGIRNGILHEAETRKWVIWRSEPQGQIVGLHEDGYALNRTVFYDAIQEEFKSYLAELRDSSKSELRKRFREKMDKICKKT